MAGEFVVDVEGVRIGGRVQGEGDPVLMLHGGPALGYEYLEPVVDELQGSFRVAVHQQRGLPPSQLEGPFEVADHVGDVRRVLDVLGWQRAVIVGHSWGGHLALHVAHALPERVVGALIIEPLGGVGDGGDAEFLAELEARTPEADWRRAEELDELGEKATPEEMQESLRLLWPAYFPTRAAAQPMPEVRMALSPFVDTMESAKAQLPVLEAALPRIRVPVGFVAGAGSPMPTTTSTDTAARIPGAWVTVLDDTGHFVWCERPGAVRAALERLIGRS